MGPKIRLMWWNQMISCLPGNLGEAGVGWTPYGSTVVCWAHKLVDKQFREFYGLSGCRVVYSIKRDTSTLLYSRSLLLIQIILSSSGSARRTSVSPTEWLVLSTELHESTEQGKPSNFGFLSLCNSTAGLTVGRKEGTCLILQRH